MTHPRNDRYLSLRSLALAAVLCVPPIALADDLADVTLLMRSGKVSQAIARADQSLAAKPRDPQMRFLKGVLQTEAGRTADAITTFTQMTEEYPELPEPYNNLAVIYAGQGEFDKARAALEMAIRTNPGYATAHENLGDVYAKLASQSYGKTLQLDPGNKSVQPKMTLIRELFAIGAKPPGGTSATPPATPASAVVPLDAAKPQAAASSPTSR
jgi:tetratricopeptide (TPR) repeat protein